jgi:hypothetical protein
MHAQSARDTAVRTHSRATTMLSSTVSFSGNFSYSFGGGTATLKADTVSNTGSTATSNLRFILVLSASPYPSSGFTTATYAFAPIAAHSSISNVNSGSIPFTAPPTGCYWAALVLQEQIGGNWTDDDAGTFSLTTDFGGGCITSFTATPASITPGQSSTLAWTTKPTVSSVSIDNGIGPMGANASTSVHPTATTTYTLTATGTANGNLVTKTTTLTVGAAAPTISSVTPNHGPTAGGTAVVIGGTNLTGATVTFGGTAVAVGSSTASTVNVTAPPHAAGPVTVTVTTSGGTASALYTYDAPAALPAITTITPAHGPITGGTKVTIAGTNLTDATSVAFGATNGTVTANTATSITVTAPAHAAGGVLVKVTTAAGSATARYDYDTPVTAPDLTQLLPVVGSAPGNFGSFFRTAVQLHNPNANSVAGRLVFHPQGQAPSSGDPSMTYSLVPGETKFYSDILPAMNASGLGTLDLLPNSGNAAPLSLVRVFNDGGSAGTTGMTIDFVRASGVLAQGDTGVLLAPPNTSGFRFNIGVRALSSGVTMSITVKNAAGTTTRTLTQSFGASSFTQSPASSIAGGDLSPNDSIAFAITSGSALIYGSTTDNTTQDPSYQSATRVPVLSPATAVIPVVGSVPGNFGSFFRTAVQMHNPLSSTVRVRAVFHNQGTNGSDSDPSLQITLAPGETKYYADILPALSLSGLGSLDIVPLDNAIPLIVSRIYNDAGANGTTGMTLGAILPADALSAGDTAVLVAPSNAGDFRYNIGIRTLANGASVQYTVRSAGGVVKKTTAATYGANYFAQLKAADVVGVDIEANDSITISVNDGSLILYGATTDNRTQDPSAQIPSRL